MQRSFLAISLLMTTVVVLADLSASPAQPKQEWGSIKGRVIWGGKDMPAPVIIPAVGVPGTGLIVNAKNKGIRNVFVYFLEEPGKPITIHPSLREIPKQPAIIGVTKAAFIPRCIAVREGQVLTIKNGTAALENIRWIGNLTEGNLGGELWINAAGMAKMEDVKPQRVPLVLESRINNWIKGRVAVFKHPYFTLTDEDGNFEIKDAPAGTHKLMIYHEEIGYRLGAKGRNGEDVTVKASDVAKLGNLPMGK